MMEIIKQAIRNILYVNHILFVDKHFNWNGTLEARYTLQEVYETLSKTSNEVLREAAECASEADYQLLRALHFESDAYPLIRKCLSDAYKSLKQLESN